MLVAIPGSSSLSLKVWEAWYLNSNKEKELYCLGETLTAIPFSITLSPHLIPSSENTALLWFHFWFTLG